LNNFGSKFKKAIPLNQLIPNIISFNQSDIPCRENGQTVICSWKIPTNLKLKMKKLLLLGAEAIAQGAIDGGMSGIYAYPGTPSTEITEYVQNSKIATEKKIHSKWSANEKTAMEAALGMSYAGKRAMVCMKHVGLNVAADPFINSAITGVNGGLVITVADDPSMHSSQNEQDSRYFGKFALIPILEPSNQQEAYDMAREGFELSEKYKTPVLIRITTRLSHSRYGVVVKETRAQNNNSLPDDSKQFVLLPAIARNRYKILLKNQINFLRPFRCRSMGLEPISQPPGYVKRAFLNRPSTGPSMKIEERSSFASESGISQRWACAASTLTSSFSRHIVHPSFSRMHIMFETSSRSGQSRMITGLVVRSEAANMGSIAFFAPQTRMLPPRRLPPTIDNFAIVRHLHSFA